MQYGVVAKSVGFGVRKAVSSSLSSVIYLGKLLNFLYLMVAYG